MEPLTALLLYSLRFVAIFWVVVLWAVALDIIDGHARDGSVAVAKLAVMADR